MTTRPIRFLHRGAVVEAQGFPPMTTVLDWLRLDRRLTGTKEGCGEGDCGACTVALGRVKHGRLAYEPANACILLLGQIDGAELVTVEDLADGERLHPVQQALVDHHGSQCGFCTPGFVMSLFTLYQEGAGADRDAVLDRLAGNLCRCTGYRPIVDAALAACSAAPDDAHARRGAATAAALAALADGDDVFVGNEEAFFAAPASLDALAALMQRHPDATLVGGATDVGLWITKHLRALARIVHTGRVAELRALSQTDEALTIGAAVTYAEAAPALGTFDPDVALLLQRLGSAQVRTAGTIGGNVANGSPIGDMPPLLIALGAEVSLRHGETVRRLPVETFFLAYGRQDRLPGEILTSLTVPKPGADEHLRAFKIAKRHDQDISSVMMALKVRLTEGRINEARIAFGGMAGIPKRAAAVEAALEGVAPDDSAAIGRAVARLGEDFSTLDDHRASAAYRLSVAGNLVTKALAEIAAGDRSTTRLAPLGGASHAA
ncbi:xanthine dehydrogenase small subunit [Phreatobacter cathodiphilus]|uniref:Xanthine dehydrogenase small subunit n=1 Tax=Phreatobacter cathodiphilus TaxID=1868589 RepID=A0A2S0N9V6_9HYPH|nr:xanthine dehydrogenase small subunit [Phreatobacter cathodiphilus]AVO44954.1 xanthine dehydrogenase small subunit [Phreatobacter cathodiphilus]